MKKDCIFIIGPESSGSTLIARIVNTALGNGKWNGRGFNCCDDPRCDAGNGYLEPHMPMDHLVCHRSLPFKDTWPPIDKWNEKYNVKYIICTGDKNISLISQLTRFTWKDDDLLQTEEDKAIAVISDLMGNPSIPTFIWFYESYILLNKPYLKLLANFLGIEAEKFNSIDAPRNGNLKYIHNPNQKSLFSRLVGR